MNLVSEASENLYIFQPGGYFVRATTSAAGMFAAGPKLVMFSSWTSTLGILFGNQT
jgi:hypothetical protein